MGHHLRTHLFCRDIFVWLSRFIEIKDSVGAQADGADGWVVQWSVFMRLGRKGAPEMARAGTCTIPLSQSGAPKLGQQGTCLGGVLLLRVGKHDGGPPLNDLAIWGRYLAGELG